VVRLLRLDGPEHRYRVSFSLTKKAAAVRAERQLPRRIPGDAQERRQPWSASMSAGSHRRWLMQTGKPRKEQRQV
jgi:hypothetical protein